MNPVHLDSRSVRLVGYVPDENPLMGSGMLAWRMTVRPHVWRPPTDVIEMEDVFLIRVEIAGMTDGDFSVTVENNLLIISGTRPDTQERKAFHQMEIHYGEFQTEIEIPATIDLEKIEAEYKDGFLRVKLPKAQPRKVIVGENKE